MTARVSIVSLVAGILGMAALGVGFAVDDRQAMFSFLSAYACVTSIAFGALILLLMTHAAHTRWFIVFRRIAEAMSLALVPLAALFVVLIVGIPALYAWSHPETISDPDLLEKVLAKRHYLSAGAFIARGVAIFAITVTTAVLLRRWSLRQDTDADPRWVLRARAFSSVILPLVAFAITFAAFDWLMSLTPAWVSTVFGVYYWAGGFVCAISLCTAVAHACQRSGKLPSTVRAPHYYAMGRLMLAFTIFWAYIAYAQGFIIWIANKPDEVSWYVPRFQGTWGLVSIVLFATQFVLPFLLLLSQERKYHPAQLAAVTVVVVIGHAIDSFWSTLPVLHPGGVAISWMDFAALLAVGGLATAFSAWHLGKAPLLPAMEPRLEIALAYKAMPTATAVALARRGASEVQP